MQEQPRESTDEHSQPEPELADPWDANDDDTKEEEEDELVLDPKHLLIVKDGTIRVAESLDDMQRDGKAGDGAKAFGTWTRVEHERFLKAMELFPKGPWKSIAEMVGTRTVRQTQTHAQKYREKMARRMRGLRNRNGTLQTAPVMPGADASGSQLVLYSAASMMQPNLPAHADIATLAAIASSAPLLQDPHAAHYYPRAMPTRRMTLPLAGGMTPSMVVGSDVLHSHEVPQFPLPHHLELSVHTVPHRLVRSASEFDALSQSSISSAFLGDAYYPSTWEAYGTAVEGKEDVPDFDESMDFLMDVYSFDPNQIGSTCAADQPATRPRDSDGGDEPARRRARTG